METMEVIVAMTKEAIVAMTKIPIILITTAALWLPLIGCQRSFESTAPVPIHKLVVTGNQHSVPIYPDEQSYVNTSRMKQEGGVQGTIGDVKQGLTAKELDDQTVVEIVSSDDDGAVVTVTDGPMKGQTGFVAKQNVE
jgi:hypothetical protein